MTAAKTTQTPAEHSNAVQGLEYFDSLFVHEKTAPAATDILARKVIREPQAIKEIVVSAGDPGDGGADSETNIDVKVNGTSVLAAVVTIQDEDADGKTVIALPETDLKAQLSVGDVLTIETGADVGDGVVDLSVEVRCCKRFSDAS
jgi:hypothetical protein